MKFVSQFFLIFIILNSIGCDIPLNNKIDKVEAEKIIKKNLTPSNINQEQLDKCNVDQIIVSDSNYLFVVNSFNGDFNGYIFSLKNNSDFANVKFEQFYITSQEITKDNWTEVYGKY